MEVVYFTLTAVALYVVSDWLLQRAELARGRRFDHRSAVFFVILLVLSISSFALIRRLMM